MQNELTDRIYFANHDGLIISLHDKAYPRPLRDQERTPADCPDKARDKKNPAVAEAPATSAN